MEEQVEILDVMVVCWTEEKVVVVGIEEKT